MNGSVGISSCFPCACFLLYYNREREKKERNLQPIRCLGKSEFVNKFIHDAINTDSTTDEFQRRILGITKDEVIAIEIGEIRTSDSARELSIHRYMYSQGQPKRRTNHHHIKKKKKKKNLTVGT